jgi:hypothetical protein
MQDCECGWAALEHVEDTLATPVGRGPGDDDDDEDGPGGGSGGNIDPDDDESYDDGNEDEDDEEPLQCAVRGTASAAGPSQGARPLGGAARSAVRGEHTRRLAAPQQSVV